MMKNLLVFLFVLSFSSAQAQHRFRMMEYNVENLFDTIHAPLHADIEFTPQGEKRWTERRYWSKLGKLARVIAAAGETSPVDLVALIEVENDSVIHHLIHRTKLWRLGYEALITHSEDIRGINVALLYQPHRFRLISHDTLRISPQNPKQRLSRDILHVAGELTTRDTLDMFVVHLPSRRGGKAAERYRTQHTVALRRVTDSLMCLRKNPHIVITGDFNAWYPEKCLSQGLGAFLPDSTVAAKPHGLYLLSYNLCAHDDIRGTYKFQGQWNQLDQFIVSGTLLQQPTRRKQLHTRMGDCRIVDFSWLLRTDKSGYGVHPHRSYLGPYYSGGYSDHLPLLLDLWY